MKINVELTEREEEILCLMLGGGLGMLAESFSAATARDAVRLVNKLLTNAPDYIPYDAETFNPTTRFPPLRRQRTQ